MFVKVSIVYEMTKIAFIYKVVLCVVCLERRRRFHSSCLLVCLKRRSFEAYNIWLLVSVLVKYFNSLVDLNEISYGRLFLKAR